MEVAVEWEERKDLCTAETGRRGSREKPLSMTMREVGINYSLEFLGWL